MSEKVRIKKCKNCGTYSLWKECPKCGSETKSPRPGPFSPEDRYGKYRRMEKERTGKDR